MSGSPIGEPPPLAGAERCHGASLGAGGGDDQIVGPCAGAFMTRPARYAGVFPARPVPSVRARAPAVGPAAQKGGRRVSFTPGSAPLHPPLYEKKGRSGGRKSEVEGKGRSRRDPAGRVPRRGGGSRGTLPRRNCLRLLCGWSAVAVGRMGLLGRSGAGTCPNLLQRRPGPGSAARRSAEYQRFSSGALTRSGPLQQIWTTRRPDPPGGAPRAAARGRRGPAFRAPGGADALPSARNAPHEPRDRVHVMKL